MAFLIEDLSSNGNSGLTDVRWRPVVFDGGLRRGQSSVVSAAEALRMAALGHMLIFQSAAQDTEGLHAEAGFQHA